MNNDEYKNKISSFYERYKRMPSYSEIMCVTGLRSKDSVFKLVKRLEEAGFVQKDRSGKIIPGKGFGEVKVLGLVEAGFPSAAEEELVDTMTLDEYLIEKKESTYMLRVKGDSMIEAGIIEGDMVLVERTSNAKEGQIVVAEVDGEWTLKYLKKKNGKPYLMPANKKYKPIYPTEELRVAAVVKAVIRKY